MIGKGTILATRRSVDNQNLIFKQNSLNKSKNNGNSDDFFNDQENHDKNKRLMVRKSTTSIQNAKIAPKYGVKIPE